MNSLTWEIYKKNKQDKQAVHSEPVDLISIKLLVTKAATMKYTIPVYQDQVIINRKFQKIKINTQLGLKQILSVSFQD